MPAVPNPADAAPNPADDAPGPVLRFVRRLARRHAGMVFGVCRRVLGNAADAEDAAHAAFLVLVQHARRLAGQPAVGDWLHCVAVRTALKTRSRRARRHAVEAAAARPGVLDPRPADDTAALVDRAVRALPAKLRDAVVLYELEGVPRLEAAARLNIPPGTLASRLAADRFKLTRRLGPVAPAVLPAEFPASAVAALARILAGTVPAGVTVLALELTRIMMLSKLKVVATGLVFAAAASIGAVVLTRGDATAQPITVAGGAVAGGPLRGKAAVVFRATEFGVRHEIFTSPEFVVIGNQTYFVGDVVGSESVARKCLPAQDIKEVVEFTTLEELGKKLRTAEDRGAGAGSPRGPAPVRVAHQEAVVLCELGGLERPDQVERVPSHPPLRPHPAKLGGQKSTCANSSSRS